jgi:impB/mucB/samB family
MLRLKKPVAVQQWNSIIALNYVAKKSGVKRGMNVFEALEVRSDMVFVHVATIMYDKAKEAKGGEMSQEHFEYGDYKAQTASKQSSSNLLDLGGEALLPGQSLLPSSISKVQILSNNP